jgi:hypothetical protein
MEFHNSATFYVTEEKQPEAPIMVHKLIDGTPRASKKPSKPS